MMGSVDDPVVQSERGPGFLGRQDVVNISSKYCLSNICIYLQYKIHRESADVDSWKVDHQKICMPVEMSLT